MKQSQRNLSLRTKVCTCGNYPQYPYHQQEDWYSYDTLQVSFCAIDGEWHHVNLEKGSVTTRRHRRLIGEQHPAYAELLSNVDAQYALLGERKTKRY